MDICIKFTEEQPKKLFAKGEIIIKNFRESFYSSLEYWNIGDYERQWEEGLRRIIINSQSCLVTTVQDPNKYPLIDWWVLYKENGKIFIQNELIVDETYEELINGNSFNVENCYNYIRPRITYTDEGEKISEWNINL